MMRPSYYKFDPVTKEVTPFENDPLDPDQTAVLQWAKEFGNADRRMAYTEIPDGMVSTVFLGLDHAWGEGPPLLFETLPFINGDGKDEYMRRYSTYAEAMAGHQEVVAEVLRDLNEKRTP
jgi:hypothetical protein